jgi:hypothetical protein
MDGTTEGAARQRGLVHLPSGQNSEGVIAWSKARNARARRHSAHGQVHRIGPAAVQRLLAVAARPPERVGLSVLAAVEKARPLDYVTVMLVRIRTDGFVDPCIPSRAPKPPSGPGWVHEG